MIGATGGCADFNRIDQRVDRLVTQRSDALGGNAAAPSIWSRPTSSTRRRNQYTKRPDTRNPSAEDMAYKGAPADRDVLTRL